MKYIHIIIFILSITPVFSQDTIIEFDRPGAADLPYLVPQQTLQIETGYGFSVNDSGSIQFDNAPGILLRFSPFKIFELRLSINYMPLSTHFSRYYTGRNLFGFGLGGKLKICKEKGFRPELAMTGLFTFSDQTFSSDGPVGLELNLLANHFLREWFYINYNVGYVYGGTTLEHSLSYSTCFGFITHKYVELFAEHFAFIHGNDVPDWGIDGGICVFPTPRLQIDLSYMRIFNAIESQNIINLGVSYNLGLHKDHYKNLYWKK